MKLRAEHACTNSIDLIDGNNNIVAMVHGPQEGEEDITPKELKIAELLCEGFNSLPESENITSD